MTIAATRFKNLSNDVNTGVADFTKITNTNILNSPLNGKSLQEAARLASLGGLIGNNAVPDISNLLSLSSGLNALSASIGKDTVKSLISLSSLSPSIASAMTAATTLHGPSGLNSVMNQLMKQISNGQALAPSGNTTASTQFTNIINGVANTSPIIKNPSTSFKSSSYSSQVMSVGGLGGISPSSLNIANSAISNAKNLSIPPISSSVPDFSGSLSNAQGISTTISDITKTVNLTGVLSNGMSPLNARATSDKNKYSIAGVNQLSGAQTNALLNQLIPNNPVLSSAIKSLPTPILNNILGKAGNSVMSSLGSNSLNKTIQDASNISGLLSSVSKMGVSSYAPVIKSTYASSSIITGLATSANDCGLPPLFSSIAPSFSSDPMAVVQAGSSIMSNAASTGDLATFADVANNPLIGSIGASSPGLANSMISNFSIPSTMNQTELPGAFNSMSSACSLADPSWNTNPITGMVSVENFNGASSDTSTMLQSAALSTDYTIPDYTLGGTPSSAASALNTTQLMYLGNSVGPTDVGTSLSNSLPNISLLPDTQITNTIINTPDISATGLTDSFGNLALAA